MIKNQKVTEWILDRFEMMIYALKVFSVVVSCLRQ